MKKIEFDANWPDSWKYSYPYDLIEVFNERNSIDEITYGRTYDFRREETISMIKKVLPKMKGSILDVAAAQGNFSILLSQLGFDVTWNDLREDLIDYVKLKAPDLSINFAPGNVFNLQFKDKFDLVLITEIIEHVAHPDEFLLQISRLVKQGGYIVLTTPLGNYFLNKLPKFSEFENPSIFESVQFKPNSDGHIFLIHYD
ncbi:MAG: methyltransferase domain-containing protein [Bacteroidia bacterium]